MNGLKGVTVYVDGSRDSILSSDTSNTKKEESSQSTHRYTFIKKVSDDCIGKKRTLMTGCGSLHFTAFFDKNTGELLETYCAKGSQGGCALFMNGLSRMMSLAARGNISVEAIVDQLKSAGTCPSYAVRKATKQDTSKGSCCPVAIGYAVMDMYNEMQNELKNKSYCNLATTQAIEKPNNGVKCPECGESLSMVEGCMSCNSCGFSRCG
jgi:ribonucleoside-diphosphate reductase alpha chain